MNCYKCKHPNLHGANFCEKCGADLKAPPPPVTPVRSYSNYHPPSSSGYHSGYSGYSDSRPSPAPKPTPAPRPMPAGSGYNPPPAPPKPEPPRPAPPQPAARRQEPKPPKPEPVRRRSPFVSSQTSQGESTPAASPRREPLPFGRLSGEGGIQFPLRYDVNLVGRASPGEGIEPQVDLTDADTSGTVSRRHARIGKDDSSIFIEDLGSSNGTRHNGQILREGMQAPLSDGDQVVFGDVVFRFELVK